jgi:hypothetical protein
METLEYVEIFTNLPSAREAIKLIGLPSLVGSGSCNKIGDNRYMIQSVDRDFSTTLIGKTASLVSTEGLQIDVTIEETTRPGLAGKVIEFESDCDPNYWSSAFVAINIKTPHKVYPVKCWREEQVSRYDVAMDAIGEIEKRRDPRGAIVGHLEYVYEQVMFWRALVEDPSLAPEMAQNGKLMTEDEILQQSLHWERVNDECTGLKKIVDELKLYRPMTDSQFNAERQPYMAIVLEAALDVSKNAAIKSMPFLDLLNTFNALNKAITEDKIVISEPESTKPNSGKGKKRREDHTSTNSDSSPDTSPESSVAEPTPLQPVAA